MADPSLVPKVSRVEIPTITSPTAYFRDPVGASLNQLQNALKFGIDRYNEEHAKVQAENLKYVEDHYAAWEKLGKEASADDVAADFYQKYGVDISSVTDSNVRRVSEGNGRIRGTKFVQEFEHRTMQGEFETVESFQKEFDKAIEEMDAGAGGDDAFRAGFLEKSTEMYDRLEAHVFDADIARRRQHELNVAATENATDFELWVSSNDPRRDDMYVASTREMLAQYKKSHKLASDEELEEPVIVNLDTLANDPRNAHGVREAAEVMLKNGFVSTLEGRNKLSQVVAKARAAEESSLLDPPMAAKQEIERLLSKAGSEFSKTKAIDEKVKQKIIEIGGTYGIERLSTVTSQLKNEFDVEKAIPADLQQDRLAINLALESGDTTQLHRMMQSGAWQDSHIQTDAHAAVVKEVFNTIEMLEGRAGQFLGEGYTRIEAVVAEREWTPDQEASLKRRLAEEAQANKWKTRPEAQAAVEAIVAEAKNEFDKTAAAGLEPIPNPVGYVQWNRNANIYAAKLEELKPRKAEVQEVLNRLGVPFMPQGMPGPGAGLEGGAPIDPKQFEVNRAYRAAKKAMDEIEEQEVVLERQRRAAAREAEFYRNTMSTKGMTKAQADSAMLYNGDANNAKIVETFRVKE